MVSSDADTTLVVQTPHGTYLCNDNSEGMNPMVSGRFRGGQYLVWVGSKQPGTRPQYQLGFSQARRARPSMLNTAPPNANANADARRGWRTPPRRRHSRR